MDSVNPDFGFVFAALFLIFGLCFGSFATAMIHREANGQSWFDWKGAASRSFCPHCRATLSAKDLVPVFSWLFLKGKCRFCAKPISVYYPLIEITCAIFSLAIFFIWGVDAKAFTAVLCVPFLVAGFYVLLAKRKFAPRLFIIPALIVSLSVFLHIFVLK